MSTRRAFLKQTAAASVAAATSVQGARTAANTAAAQRRVKAHRGPRTGSVVQLAIVGVGDISPRYLKQAAASQRARFVATCAHHLESAKARALEYGIGAWYDDYTAMYDAIAPDGVVIATPNSLHAAPAIAAFERGIHVLCEKPMATTWEDCRAMVAAAQRSGAVFLALPYDATPPFLAALDLLNEATLGVFTGAEAQLLIPGTGRDNWYYDRSVVGGVMLDTMVYPVSRLIGLMGPARRVTGFVNTLIPHRIVGGNTVDLVPPLLGGKSKVVKSNVDDNVSLVVEWSGGQQALVRALWGTSFVRNDSAIYGRHGTLWLSGNDVVIHSPERAMPGAKPVTRESYKGCYRLPVKALEDIRDEGLVGHFVDCIEGLRQPTCGGQQQLHVHEILFKGYEAARSGRAQELETSFTPWHRIDPSFHDPRSRPI
ncbi:MAG: Gfo/Idh/MocA family oxidoreductase [Acidobacteria bacterium]|nr:Gfo/Idh/MocA family oxidoreductase [Acidobacteriota bacterium]